MARRLVSVGAIVASVLALVPNIQTARAADDFPIAGTYTQGRACKGDGTDHKALIVIISSTEIQHRQGVCTISDKRVDGDKITLNATCTTRGGHVMAGDVTFTRRDENTFDMVDQDATMKAVLHRCPEK